MLEYKYKLKYGDIFFMFDIYNKKGVFRKNVLPRHACGFPLNESNQPKTKLLSGNWKFKFCNNYSEIPEDFVKEDFDLSSFDTVKVPSEWQILGYDVPLYANIKYPYELSMNPLLIPHINAKKNTVGLYATDFIADKKAGETRLYFGGINPSGEIYLNGKFIGYSEDTFSYQEYDVTGIVKQGKNRLCVVVFRYCTGSYLEDQDMWRLSGIFRDVYLVENASRHIEDAYYNCKLNETYDKAEITLNANYVTSDKSTDITATLIAPDKTTKPFILKTNEDGNATFVLSLDEIDLWSHEKPNLYHIEIQLKSGNVLCDKRIIPCGLREVKIVPMENGRGPYILLNGKPVKFRGVNRHEFHPEYGHAVPVELIKKDLEICLHNNITAIRCCHYPNNHAFYDLCDQMGILVIAETNLETHGLSGILPKNSKYWEKQCVYRCTNMVNALRNHPSIVCWSLGNEAGCGKVFANMKKAILALDKSRFIHYEGDVTGKISDVMSEMYTRQEEMKEIGKGEKRHKHGVSLAYPFGRMYSVKKYKDLPFMQCEYSHCMGNSLGNFSDYWDDFKKYDRLAGGFIWDFADQSIKRTDPDGTVRWTYGGDFGDQPNFGSFCFNGILRADRTPNPAFFEVKKQHQMVDFTLEEQVLRLQNNYMFTNLNKFYLDAEYYENGELVATQRYDVPSVEGGDYTEINLTDIPKTTQESVLIVSLKLIENDIVLKKDETVAYEQFILRKSDFNLPKLPEDLPDVQETEWEISVKNSELLVIFDKMSGGLTSIVKNDKEMLKMPILPNFVRPTIDNDSYKIAPKFLADLIKRPNKYFIAQKKLRPKKITVTKDDEYAKVNIVWKYPYAKQLTTSYLIGKSEIDVSMTINPSIGIIRYGFDFALREEISGMKFYGKGPHENYCDRATAALLKKYEGVAEDFNHEYLYPQANGNHTETRYLDIGSEDNGIIINAIEKPFEFSVLPYSIEKLEKATHLHELVKDGYYTVNIDGKQRGVGGDGTGIAYLKPQYDIHAKQNYSLQFRLTVK